MDAEKRMRLIRVIKKIEKNPVFSEKIGIRNKSEFNPKKRRK
ncbi:MAG: hypothetical protein ACI4EC_05180 [Lachnospiraceae bacterium]